MFLFIHETSFRIRLLNIYQSLSYLSEFESATFGQARQNYSYKNTSRIKEASQQQQITQITQNTIRKKYMLTCMINRMDIIRTSDGSVRCIKPWILIAQRREYDLNGISHRVHWRRNRLTAKHDSIIMVICSNVYNCNTRACSIKITVVTFLIWSQLKVVESKFYDVPIGNCDIPCTSAVLSVVIWKIGACNESS